MANTVEVYPQIGRTYPDALGNPIDAAGAIVDESRYILDSIAAGYLLTTDPLKVFEPDDRSGTTGGAPLVSTYIVASADVILPNELVLTAGTGITVTQGAGTITVAATAEGGGAPVGASYLVAGLDGTLTNERALQGVFPVVLTDNGPGSTMLVTAPSAVVGPITTVDNAIPRFDGATGKVVQGSSARIDDGGNLDLLGNITLTGTVDGVDVSALEATVSAVSAASFVTIGGHANLTNERTLAVTAPIVLTDLGANSTATLSAPTVAIGAASAVDNQIVRFDGTGGKVLQSGANTPSIDDSGNIVMVGAATVDGVDVSALATTVGTLAVPSYLTLGATATLTNERVLTAGVGVAFTDAGAGGALTVSANSGRGSNGIAGTTYTFVLADQGKEVIPISGSATTFTIPLNATVAFPVGTTIFLLQDGAGALSVDFALGVTLRVQTGCNAKLRARWAEATLYKTGTDSWNLSGDLEETAQYLMLAGDATKANERILTAGTNISFVDGGAGSTLTINSTAGGAPAVAQYLTLATDATLTNERVLTAGAGMAFTDAGAGSTLTVAQNTGINSQAGTTYTPVLSDAGKMIVQSNAAAITTTIPPNSSVAFPVGTKISFMQGQAGPVTLAPGLGVTLLAPGSPIRTSVLYGVLHATQIAANNWQISGDLAASPTASYYAQGSLAATAVVTSTETVVVATEAFDSNNNFASNAYTAPFNGLYSISADLEGNFSTGAHFTRLQCTIGGTPISTLSKGYGFGVAAGYTSASLAQTARLAAGDVLRFSVFQDSGVNRTYTGHFSIFLVTAV